jgi:dienelactone hydrolase
MSTRGLTVAGVPVLMARPVVPHSGSIPTVLWCHGFRADALAHARELERCARAGFLAIGLDAVGHGARLDTGMSDRIARDGGALPLMLEQVEQTVDELPNLIRTLSTDFNADAGAMSLVGISMGAFLAYRAVGAGLPVRAVVALLGSPEWSSSTSAHLVPQCFRDVALLSVTAEHDVSVPPAAVVRLHAALDTRYGRTSSRRHDVLQGAGHLTSAQEWEQAMQATMGWLEQYGGARSAGRVAASPAP